MFKGIIKKQKSPKNDEFGLMRKITVRDVKGYLQKEFERAAKREQEIINLEGQIGELEKVRLAYEAMLVVQEKTQERIEAQDERIKELKADIAEHKKTEQQLRAKIVDIKANAEKKLKAMRDRVKKTKK